MSNQHPAKHDQNQEGVIYAPWERRFIKVLTPFDEFVHGQTTSGLLLMASAVIALLLANSALADFYNHVTHTLIGLNIGEWKLEMSLHHWVNDALMAVFFFLVGMELKREILVGELSDLRKAALPIVAAIGGMLVPAALFFFMNPDGDASRGWGIPMATDIAFAVGALVLLGNKVPKTLVTFLVALAIVDDLGAVLVIALFYTKELVPMWLGVAALLVAVLVFFNFIGIRRAIPYFLVAVLLWYALLQSGVHATIAGVLGAFSVPARPKYDPSLFVSRLRELVERFKEGLDSGKNIMTNHQLQAVAQSLETDVNYVQTPLQSLEHHWHVPVAFFVIPIFALFNAGVPLQFESWSAVLSNSIVLGVILGLVVGKFVGIVGASWIFLKLGLSQLPTGVKFNQLAGVALLAGIGFTMSIFVAELAYAPHPDYLVMAKVGILSASLIAGVMGYVWLWMVANKN
ncbi:MAG: Na+/H+ antiporter NhaA [Methylophilaceae bacterium]|nr:Na+/H+ antiporter NhaA [Methylophilaceae bacterium]MDG1453569.1 Na+/H+ antiporter NhaA [Methylophilaceae bacterium]